MNSLKHTQPQDLVRKLKKDSQQWNQSPSEAHQQRTLQAIRDELSSTQPTRKVIPLPLLSPAWVAVAAILVLSAAFLVDQLNQPEPEAIPVVLSHKQIEADLEVLTILPQLPDQLAVSVSLLEDPFIEELDAIVGEMTATIQGLLELVEAS